MNRSKSIVEDFGLAIWSIALAAASVPIFYFRKSLRAVGFQLDAIRPRGLTDDSALGALDIRVDSLQLGLGNVSSGMHKYYVIVLAFAFVFLALWMWQRKSSTSIRLLVGLSVLAIVFFPFLTSPIE